MHIEIILTQTEVIITSILPPLIFVSYHLLKTYLYARVLKDVKRKK